MSAEEPIPQQEPAQEQAENQQPQSEEPAKPHFQIHVANLSYETTEEKLRAKFEEYGTVFSTRIPQRGGRSKGFGFVEMNDEEGSKAIEEINRNPPEIDGRLIRVEQARTSEENAQRRKEMMRNRPSYDHRRRERDYYRDDRDYDRRRDYDYGRDRGYDRDRYYDRDRDYGRDRGYDRDYGRDYDYRRDYDRDNYRHREYD